MIITRKRIPFEGIFELTGRCNFNCKMCLVRVDEKRIRELGLRERTAEEWIDMAEQAAAAGTLKITLTGGEPFLRPDFCEIYEAIYKKGFLLTLFTNAVLLNPKIFDLLKKYPPHVIGVTMYGSSNDTYLRLCGIKNGHDRFVANFKQLLKLPSLIDLRTTIVKDNAEDLPGIKAFSKEIFGDERSLHISRFVSKSIRGGICSPEDVRLDPESSVRCTETWLHDLKKEVAEESYKKLIFSNVRKCSHKSCYTESGKYLFEACDAGVTQYAINWAGRMYACELMTEGFTEPFRDGFGSAWERLPEQYPLSRPIAECHECKYNAVCETCYANRIAETGDWFGIPAYSCEEARVKYDLMTDIGVLPGGVE